MIEGLILKQFQFISIPHAQALSTYLNFKKRSQIKIIPQGVNRENYTQQTWKAHPDKVRFAYAGRFFLDIRNPESLFQFLESVTQNFEFTIYTSLQDQLIIDMLNKYNLRLNNRLIIHHFIPRQQLIYELSGYDFLINMNNTRANQSPSKQLDYALTGRPVLNINQDNLHLPIFQDFLQKDFSSWKPQINLDKILSKISKTMRALWFSPDLAVHNQNNQINTFRTAD
jgi:hypothetical protein